MEIILYRDDFKAPQDGVEDWYTFFDTVLGDLGIPLDERQDIDEVTLVVSEIKTGGENDQETKDKNQC